MTTTLTKPRRQVPVANRNPIALLRDEMDNLITRFWDGKDAIWQIAPFEPLADIVEEANAYELRLDVPGMEAKDIDVQVHGNTVTVRGKREEEKEEKGKEFHRVERHTGEFARTLILPCNLNEDEVVAAYDKGVLKVKLPKCEAAEAKKIAVKG